jgi:hypothetical protein
VHEVCTFSKTTEVWTRENYGLGWYEFSCARRFLGACYDSCVMAVALPLALAIIPIFIALYALRVSLRAEKYSRAQVDLMQEQETKREREQAS